MNVCNHLNSGDLVVEGESLKLEYFLDILESGNYAVLGPSVLTWTVSVDETNFAQLPLLKIDPEVGHVSKDCSLFYKMRNAKTFKEWVSLMFYIVCTVIGHVHHRKLPSASGSEMGRNTLAARCLMKSKLMRTQSVSLLDLFENTFLRRTKSVLSMFWGTEYIWKAFNARKVQSSRLSQVRIITLIQEVFSTTIEKISKRPDLLNFQLSVASLVVG